MDDIQEQLLNQITALNPTDYVRTVSGIGTTPDSTFMTKSDFVDSLFADAVSFSIVANANDVTFTGMSTSHMVRMSNNGSYNITGLQTGKPGRILILHNIGAGTLTLVDESPLSLDYNRFALTANISMSPDTMVILQYDGTTQRWRAAGGGGGGVADHGMLTGLADDDHLQYHTDARGDARYPLIAHDHVGGDGNPIVEAALSLSDITTNDVTTGRHGLMPKLQGSAYKSFRGDGSWIYTPSFDGWIRHTDSSFAYASPTTFTISGDYTSVFRRCSRLVWNDSVGWKYGIVLSSSYSAPNTTVTIMTNTDYVISAGMTDLYVSYEVLPNGFPSGFNYTPQTSNVTIGNGSISGRYFAVGSQMFGAWLLTFGSTTALTGYAYVALPVTTQEYGYFVVGNVSLVDWATSLYTGIHLSDHSIRCMVVNGTYAVYGYVNATTPHTWGASDVMSGSYRYRWF